MSPSSSINIDGFINPVPFVNPLGITNGANRPPAATDRCTKFMRKKVYPAIADGVYIVKRFIKLELQSMIDEPELSEQ